LQTGGRILTKKSLPAQQRHRADVIRSTLKDEDVVIYLRVSRRSSTTVVETLKGSQGRERIREPSTTGSECQGRACGRVVVNEPDYAAHGQGHRSRAGLAGGIVHCVSESIRTLETYRWIVGKAAVGIDRDIITGRAIRARDAPRRGQKSSVIPGVRIDIIYQQACRGVGLYAHVANHIVGVVKSDGR